MSAAQQIDPHTGEIHEPEVTDYKEMRSGSLGKLAGALARAQGDMPPVKPTGWNPHLKKHYASFADIKAAAQKPLADAEIAVIQRPLDSGDPAMVRMSTSMVHSSGEWIEGVITLAVTGPDHQAKGAAISYAKKYTFASMTGVAIEGEDDSPDQGGGSKQGSKTHGNQRSNQSGNRQQGQQSGHSPNQGASQGDASPSSQSTQGKGSKSITIDEAVERVQKISTLENAESGISWAKKTFLGQEQTRLLSAIVQRVEAIVSAMETTSDLADADAWVHRVLPEGAVDDEHRNSLLNLISNRAIQVASGSESEATEATEAT